MRKILLSTAFSLILSATYASASSDKGYNTQSLANAKAPVYTVKIEIETPANDGMDRRDSSFNIETQALNDTPFSETNTRAFVSEISAPHRSFDPLGIMTAVFGKTTEIKTNTVTTGISAIVKLQPVTSSTVAIDYSLFHSSIAEMHPVCVGDSTAKQSESEKNCAEFPVLDRYNAKGSFVLPLGKRVMIESQEPGFRKGLEQNMQLNPSKVYLTVMRSQPF